MKYFTIKYFVTFGSFGNKSWTVALEKENVYNAVVR